MEAQPCFVCGGSGMEIFDEEGPDERFDPCSWCRGLGGRALKTAGPGYPKLKDGESPWEPARYDG